MPEFSPTPSSELLVLFWGLFFIATRDDRTPQLRARDFVQPVKEIIRRRSLSVDSGTSASQQEERPHWESAYGGNSNHNASSAGTTRAGGTAAAAGFPAMPPVNNGTSRGRSRRRIVSEFQNVENSFVADVRLHGWRPIDRCEDVATFSRIGALVCVGVLVK